MKLPHSEIKKFKSPADWIKWLTKNHSKSTGIWIRIFKKDSSSKSLTYSEALDGALCYGWIDGQKQKLDPESWLQKFTPRRVKSGWSKINTRHAERLIKAGAMTPEGLNAVREAKADGRWKAAYDSPSQSKLPEDLLKELKKSKKAEAFFKSLNKTNVYSITYRLQTAKKPETRQRRMEQILSMLKNGKKFHP